MAECTWNETTRPNDFNIIANAGFFTVHFRSPYNSVHQITGFRSEDDAQAWVTEVRNLAKSLD